MNDTHRLVQRLWALCGVLRDDGIAYHQYVDELSYLLFLKLRMDEQGDRTLVDGQVWEELTGAGPDALQAYKKALASLARSEDGGLQLIFQGATTSLRREESLRRLVEGLDALRLQGKGHQALGDLYEGLLQKNAAEKKSGAGQYFTPRALVEGLVELIQPRPEEVVSDPAAGTLGFLTCANAYIQRTSSDGRGLSPESYGVELVPDTCRVARMNAHLHGLQARVLLGDTLSPMGTDLPPSDVILTNPPFGARSAPRQAPRDDLQAPTGNKQLAFLQHIMGNLKPGGRAAVVVSDNVLFDKNAGLRVRRELMNTCELHTVLRLPTGIFYAPGVQTNVLFFRRGGDGQVGQTQDVWFYDLRTGMPSFGKRNPFTRDHLAPFISAYGQDRHGLADRVDEDPNGRFRRFTRAEVSERDDDLDITWLPASDASTGSGDPAAVAREVLAHLDDARESIASVIRTLDDD